MDALVGSGGFAWVYRGYDPELDIPVAIKVLKPQFAGESEFEERFRREASTAAKLRHPNIIRILAVGRDAGAVYFVMDFLPGTLDERLRAMEKLPEPLLLRLGMDVSAALAFAHRESVIHRDIKTDNILFDAHGNAVVADFGIARAMVDYVGRTGTNMVVGTPQYFSPEQARGLALDGRADIYSLGVTLYKAATGVLPFQGSDWYEIARQHVEDSPPRPRLLNPALSENAERIILTCLAKDPADRYATGDALYTDLAQLSARGGSLQETETVVMPAPPDRHASGRNRVRTWWEHLPRTRVLLVWLAVAALVLAGSAAAMRFRGSLFAGASPPRTPHPADTVKMASTASTADTPATLPPVSASAPVPRPVLHIDAPANATIEIDGFHLAPGTHNVPNIPGTHRVVATVPSPRGCSWARDESTVLVQDTGATAVTLAPRSCGYVAPDIVPAAATWSVLLASGGALAHGSGIPGDSALLPAGSHALEVSAPYCATYRAPVVVTAGHTTHVRVRLLCEPAHQ